jgi:hypothetical protein
VYDYEYYDDEFSDYHDYDDEFADYHHEFADYYHEFADYDYDDDYDACGECCLSDDDEYDKIRDQLLLGEYLCSIILQVLSEIFVALQVSSFDRTL